MGRTKLLKESEGGVVTPKPTTINKQKPTTESGKIEEPKVKALSIQPKRKTLQDKRPALKNLSKLVERKIVSKPVYGKQEGTVTKTISETKEVIQKTTLGPTKPIPKVRPKGVSALGGRAAKKDLIYARKQQERAIEEAQAAAAVKERRLGDSISESEQRRREKEEADYRLSLDSQSRYHRGR